MVQVDGYRQRLEWMRMVYARVAARWMRANLAGESRIDHFK
jgi:hypothetical protein